eukprot:CAMPEP_0198494954 /NCGR_PEP_ID=MMETSP1462-20131121/4914_1 /TAXON_ID=1333877 /ORGANISM="Brandtodinium nutriculum, Strain RCC3387" /LENGTH=73 /DNA_ID=CAMNT_0044223707 /DNA_START=132 /DNA_END=350 /DNA_ORIENTATION=-
MRTRARTRACARAARFSARAQATAQVKRSKWPVRGTCWRTLLPGSLVFEVNAKYAEFDCVRACVARSAVLAEK